jgi:putative FmdB family regulatory protein
MPIYEFYCSQCNTIYNFFSKTANTAKIPHCPKCLNIPLQRQMSMFATVSGKEETHSEDPFAGLDEQKMEKELTKLAAEAQNMKEDDPRAAVQLMRKFSKMTGMKLGGGFEEALNRMEKGEDPEKIEEEMGDIWAEEEPFVQQHLKKESERKARVDEALYDL